MFTFKGGIHPADGKDMSKDKPIREVLPKKELVFPLSMHIGAPAKPVVKRNDKVLVGQLIAEASGFVSAPIHSTVSGKVKRIEKRRTVTGDMVESIIIENDELYEQIDFGPIIPLEDLTREDILQKIKDAGIVGMGGAGFPTFIKLSPKNPERIDRIIVNAAECEPYLTSDYRRMLENPEMLIGGLQIILKIFENAKGIIGIEDNKPEAIKKLVDLTKNIPNIDVMALHTKYPQGGERQLIFATTGRELNSSMLPADVGAIVNNVDTVVAIYNAIHKNQPLMHRIVTITGDAISDPRNLIVRIGTSYKDLIEEAGGFKTKPEKVISGGPMMGFAVFDENVPVVKTSSALLCLTKDEVAENTESPCINCSRCVTVCPAGLLPCKLSDFGKRADTDSFQAYYGMECIECGSCSYACPSKIQLLHSIKSARRQVLAMRRRG